MKAKHVAQYLNEYIEKYPEMADNDLVIDMPNPKRRRGGDFYLRHRVSGLGWSSLVSENQLHISIEPVVN